MESHNAGNNHRHRSEQDYNCNNYSGGSDGGVPGVIDKLLARHHHSPPTSAGKAAVALMVPITPGTCAVTVMSPEDSATATEISSRGGWYSTPMACARAAAPAISTAEIYAAMLAIAPTIAAATIISTVNESAASMVTEPRSLKSSFFTCFSPYLKCARLTSRVRQAISNNSFNGIDRKSVV